jgi:uncharacterized protein YjbJ (UPF0337 family)
VTKAKRLKNRIAGKAKHITGEVVGDQGEQEEGKAQDEKAESEDQEPGDLNPFASLNRLT